MITEPQSGISAGEPDAERTRRRLLFVSYMAGVRPGNITTQGLVLSRLFRSAGYSVVACSEFRNRPLRMLDIIATLVRRLPRTDFLIIDVYSDLNFINAEVASWFGERFGCKVILWLHGGALPEFIVRFPRWTRGVLGRADAIVAPTPFLARSAEQCGCAAQVIPNVIELDDYRFVPRKRLRPRLFWMRSFHEIYNPEMAIRVLAGVRAVHPEATLVLGGRDKGTLHAVEQLAAQLGLGAAVRFAGFLDRAGKERESAAADIFLNTSDIDNTPVAILEACAMGLPVVTTAVGGIPDMLRDGETGLLVPGRDDRAMTGAVLRLLADEGLAARLSTAGRALAERSSSRLVLPQWEELFQELARREAGGTAASHFPARSGTA